MTVHDAILIPPHDPTSQLQPSSTSRRRRALSTASSTTTSKRSPSPRVTFTAAPLSSDSKGVKNITRKVIRTLEGLGHLDNIDMYEEDCDSDERLDQTEATLTLNGSANNRESASLAPHQGTHANGSASPSGMSVSDSRQPKHQKIDWEIPRKVLHSSIGVCNFHFPLTRSHTCYDPRIFHRVPLHLRG
jgi:diacylglycerol kinase (CTP)